MNLTDQMDYLRKPDAPKCPPQAWLARQTALVTGASSGIGQRIAIALGAYGANVIVNYASFKEKARDLVSSFFRKGARAIDVKADVSSEEEAESMYGTLLAEFGTLDILVSSAGVQQDAAIDQLTLAQWHKVIGVSLIGEFLTLSMAAYFRDPVE